MPLLTRRFRKVTALYFTEMVIIFLGITFSFLFEQWRQERAQRQTQMETLTIIKEDIIDKIKESAQDSAEFASMATSIHNVLLLSNRGTGAVFNDETFRRTLNYFKPSTHYFQWYTSSYQLIILNNQLKTIKNDTLLRKVLDFYQRVMYSTSLSYDRLSGFRNNQGVTLLAHLPRAFSEESGAMELTANAVFVDPIASKYLSDLRIHFLFCSEDDGMVRKHGIQLVKQIEMEIIKLKK